MFLSKRGVVHNWRLWEQSKLKVGSQSKSTIGMRGHLWLTPPWKLFWVSADVTTQDQVVLSAERLRWHKLRPLIFSPSPENVSHNLVIVEKLRWFVFKLSSRNSESCGTLEQPQSHFRPSLHRSRDIREMFRGFLHGRNYIKSWNDIQTCENGDRDRVSEETAALSARAERPHLLSQLQVITLGQEVVRICEPSLILTCYIRSIM